MSFRHFVRHAYSFAIDPRTIETVIDKTPNLVDGSEHVVGAIQPVKRRHKVNPGDLDLAASIKLVALSQKTIAVRCRLLDSDRAITLRSSSHDLAVPGEIIFVRPKKQWSYAGHPYLSGDIESVKFDAAALGRGRRTARKMGRTNRLSRTATII